MNFKNLFSDFFSKTSSEKYHFSILSGGGNYNKDNASSSLIDTSTNSPTTPKNLFTNIDENLNTMKSIYNALINSDIITREFACHIGKRKYRAFIMYFDGMADSQMINDFLLEPLMQIDFKSSFNKNMPLDKCILSNLIPQNNIKTTNSFSEVSSAINSGNCVLFIDTLNVAFNIDAKNFKQRSIQAPENETVIRGPHEAFVENIRTNTSLLRRIINNENLIIESTKIGTLSKTTCCICYMQNIVNGDLLSEIKYRLNNLDIETVESSGQLEQLIEENKSYGIPQVIATERPDKCAKSLYQGRVVVLLNGNPYALIMPTVAIDFLASPEDTNMKSNFANFLRFLRIIASAITLLLPGVYIAITSFHQEILPTELLFSILSSRENVPFPIIVELLVMEIAFELIREAGIRIPSPIGSTIGIVGGLIIGEAAVSASIVSPILVIIVAITGIASFAIPDFAFGFHLRTFRFLFILLGATLGFLGIGVGVFAYLSILCNIKSFGVPFMAPFAPFSLNKSIGYVVPPTWKQENRNIFVSPQEIKRQNKISKKWEF